MNEKVKIKNTTSGRIGINIPDLKLSRIWERKNVVKTIDFSDLEQAMYDPGVEYMIRQGMLEIEDMEVKIALGLEEEGTKEPVNIIVLSEKDMERYLKHLPLADFKKKLADLPKEQIYNLLDYAIEKEIAPLDKNEVLKEITGTDVIQAIKLKKQAQEN